MNISKTVEGQGEDVVILHEWGRCDSRHMQPIVDQLSNRYRVINVDLPGCGDSEWLPSTQNIHDIADQFLPELPKQAIYIGWSFGGLVAMSIAAGHPERIKRFVGLTTTPKFVEADNWLGVPTQGPISAFSETQKNGVNELFYAYYDREFSGIDPKPAAYHKLIDLLNDCPWNVDILLKGINIIDAADLRKEFATIKCPIDLILGEKDSSMLVASVEQVKRLNPKTNIHIIQDAQHMPFWTHPQEFNKILNAII